jgi:hypothetical protein
VVSHPAWRDVFDDLLEATGPPEAATATSELMDIVVPGGAALSIEAPELVAEILVKLRWWSGTPTVPTY